MEVKLLVFQLSLLLLLVFGKPTLDDDRGEWICKSKPPMDDNGGCGCGCGCGCNGTCGCANLTFDIANFLDMYTPSTKPKKDVIFYLYKSPSESIELNQDNVENLDKNLETKIIIHGWFGDANATWALKMKDEYLKAGEYNVIIIDYGYYAKTGYYKAVKNRHQVGEKIAKLLIAAEKHAGLDFNKVHLIGHSLGAHVCAEVAEHLQKASVLYKLNRISGLDPAGPLFHNSTMRESAKFVDIYHTGAIFFGIKKEIGTADYYINGGLMQPDCKTQSVGNKSLRYGLNVFYEILNFANNKCAAKVWDISCNHGTSTWYWVNSIGSNKSHDSDRGEVIIGEHADPILTGAFCVYDVRLEIPNVYV